MSHSWLGDALGSALSVLLAVSSSVVATTLPSHDAPAGRVAADLTVGRDVSWPNCPRGLGMPSRPTQGKPMPPAGAQFVVIGLTNGPAFHPNPCLAAQVDYARTHQLWTAAYAVLTYPTHRQLRRYGATGPADPATRSGRLANTGWAQARQNLAALRATGLRTPIVWVDVETVGPPAPWSHRPAANRAVLRGALAGYRGAGLRVGIYSTPTMWRDLLGGLRPGLPEWRTAGEATSRAALDRCRGPGFQGGHAVVAQWYSPREDFDLLCPSMAPGDPMATYFAAP